MPMPTDSLVQDYLVRLDSVAGALPVDRRRELVGEVREHIEAALAQTGTPDEVSVRNVLERLGPAEDIVAAELGNGSQSAAWAAAPLPGAASPWGPMEIIAILLLTLGAVFLPFLGPLIGLVFVWASRAWTGREKAIASVIVLALLSLPLIAIVAARAAL
jgi:hypothetical protein